MEESSGPSTKVIIGLVVIVLLVIAATGAVIASSNGKSKSSDIVASSSPSTSGKPSRGTTSSTSASGYKDGDHNATSTYESPGGEESVSVKLTLADGSITSVSTTAKSNVAEAKDYQNQFLAAYKSQVVGKKITDVNLTRIAGSSLTSIGFNSAIDKIKSEAQS